MDNKEKLDLSTANMQVMTERDVMAAEFAKGFSSSSVHIRDGIVYTPKIGEVFAQVHDAKVLRIILTIDEKKGAFQNFEEIDFANGNKEVSHFLFEKTMKGGVFEVYNFFNSNKNGTYIRVSPELWAKAMKQRGIFLSSLNALNYSITPSEPFNEQQ